MGKSCPYNMKLTYYLLTDSVREEYCDLKVYGVEIAKRCIKDEKVLEKEKKIIKNLFFNREEAESFLDKIIKEKTTPLELKSAVSTHIGEKIKLITCEG